MRLPAKLTRFPRPLPTGVLALGCDPDCRSPSIAAVLVRKVGAREFKHTLLGFRYYSASGPLDAIQQWHDAVVGNWLWDVAGTVPFGGTILAVESQEIYLGRSSSVPRDLIDLAHVAGAMLATPTDLVVCPTAAEWKGQQSKDTNQGRTWHKFGIKCKLAGGKKPYCVPETVDPRLFAPHPVPAKSLWKHLGDSLGLACWAGEVSQ